MHVTILDIWHGACLKKEKACMNDNSILLKISKELYSKDTKKLAVACFVLRRNATTTGTTTELPPGGAFALSFGAPRRVLRLLRVAGRKPQATRMKQTATQTGSHCSYHRPQLFWPYNKQSKSKIRKSFQKPRGPVGKLLATTCGHPLAAHAASTNSRLFKDFYVLRCSWNMSSTRNGSQSSTDFGFLTEIPHPGYLPGRCLTRAATKNETPTPWVYLCCHVTICTIYMVCHGNLAALAPFCVPFCWSYVLYRLLQSLWTTFLEAMFSWYITFSCSLRGYGPKNRICTKNSAIIPRCTPNIIVTTRMTWNILKLRNPNEKNLYLLYSILTAGFGNQKKIATNLLSAQPAPQQSTKSSQESRIYLPFKKKRALAKIDEERNNQWHDKSPKIVLNWLET